MSTTLRSYPGVGYSTISSARLFSVSFLSVSAFDPAPSANSTPPSYSITGCLLLESGLASGSTGFTFASKAAAFSFLVSSIALRTLDQVRKASMSVNII